MKTTIILSSILALSAAVPALAADCAGANWGKPNMDVYWSVREVVCKCYGSGKSNCNYNDQRLSISFSGSKPSQQQCWDATENIINQCIGSGMSPQPQRPYG